jgi:hypothetical protein
MLKFAPNEINGVIDLPMIDNEDEILLAILL